jgi:hypothetical protein
MTTNMAELAASEKIDIAELNMLDNAEVTLNAGAIDVAIAANDQEMVNVTVEGYAADSMAESLDLNVQGTQRLRLTKLRADEGTIAVTGDITFDDATVNRTLDINTQNLSLYMNNNDLTPVDDVDVQLASVETPFWMITDGSDVSTNAQFIRKEVPVPQSAAVPSSIDVPPIIIEDNRYRLGLLSIFDIQLNAGRLSESLPALPKIRWIDQVFDWSSIMQGVRTRNRNQSDVLQQQENSDDDSLKGESIGLEDILAFQQVQKGNQQGEG